MVLPASAEQLEVDAEDVAVEEEQGGEGLVLRGGRHVLVDGKWGEEGFDFGCGHVGRVALVVEEDVAPDPVQVGGLGARRVVSAPERGVDLVKELGRHAIPLGGEPGTEGACL